MRTKTILSTILLTGFLATSCTDLTEHLYDKVSTNDYGKDENDMALARPKATV